MSKKQIRRVLAFHGIPAGRLDSLYRLVNGCAGAGDRECVRLTRKDRVYRAALNTMLDVLSAPFVRLFGDVPNLRAIAMAGKA
ncbi:MAG TPA: hypothetical protein VGM05_30835 [Planctomycetaceae bacterium]|jgi:hypothetical protein